MDSVVSFGLSVPAGLFGIAVWLTALVGLLVYVSTTEYSENNEGIFWFESAFRTGSLIFGGGQVVVPVMIHGSSIDSSLRVLISDRLYEINRSYCLR